MRKSTYNTNQKEAIKEAVKEFSNGFTIKELKELLDSKNAKIGLTTIYRLVTELENDMVLKKYFDEKNIAHYKYVKDCINGNHFYLKCTKCNKIEHVDCSCINDFQTHIYKQHKFLLDSKNIILEGLCSNCNRFF